MSEGRKVLSRKIVEGVIESVGLVPAEVKSVYIEPGLGSVTVKPVKGRPQYFDLE